MFIKNVPLPSLRLISNTKQPSSNLPKYEWLGHDDLSFIFGKGILKGSQSLKVNMELDEFSGSSTNPCLDLVKMIGASQLISSIVGKQLNIIPNHKWKHKQTPEVVEVDHKNFTQFSVNNTHPNIFLPTTTIQPSKADLSFLWWGGGSFSNWWFQPI